MNTATSLRPRSRSTLDLTAEIVEAAVPEHEQDDRLVVRVGPSPPAREARARPRTPPPSPGRRLPPPAGGTVVGPATAAEPVLGGCRVDPRARGGRRAAAGVSPAQAPRPAGGGSVRRRAAARGTPLLISRKADDHAPGRRAPQIWATGLSFRALLTGRPLPRAAPARPQENEGPNLPAPPGLRTLLRRWASTDGPTCGPPEIDS